MQELIRQGIFLFSKEVIINMLSDVVTLEVIKNRFSAIVNQMTYTMKRSAYSQIIKEMKDASSSLFDSKLNLIAEGTDIPIHLGMLKPCLQEIFSLYIKREELNPGDVIITNDPYIGKDGMSTGPHHTNDVVIAMPIFYKGELVGIAANVGHHRDVGAKWSEGRGWNLEIWEEGIKVPPVKLYKKGVLDKNIMEIILENTRVPYDMEGDLEAQITACKFCIKEVQEMFKKYGKTTILQTIEDLIEYSERLTRAEIKKGFPEGFYKCTIPVLDDGSYGGPYTLKVKITIKGSDVIVDYAGTDKQIVGSINAPWSATYSATCYTFRCLTDPTITSNDGASRPIHIKAPKGSLVNCTKPAACRHRMYICHSIVDVIMGALKEVIPDRVMAESCGAAYNNASAINQKTHPQGGEIGEPRQRWGEVVPNGLGARAHKDGMSVMACHVTNVPIPSIEAAEIEAPVLYLKREFNPNSAGPGKYRGGFGQILKWKTLGEDTRFNHEAQKHGIHPQGIFGGKAGRSGEWIINEREENERILTHQIGDTMTLKIGDTVALYGVGGGGYGNPIERTPEAVRLDLINEFININQAKEDYKVIIDPKTLEVDMNGTEKLRRSIKVEQEKENKII